MKAHYVFLKFVLSLVCSFPVCFRLKSKENISTTSNFPTFLNEKVEQQESTLKDPDDIAKQALCVNLD